MKIINLFNGVWQNSSLVDDPRCRSKVESLEGPSGDEWKLVSVQKRNRMDDDNVNNKKKGKKGEVGLGSLCEGAPNIMVS